jgi:hypothetical protein
MAAILAFERGCAYGKSFRRLAGAPTGARADFVHARMKPVAMR